MANVTRTPQVTPEVLEEKLNHLEYVLEETKKIVAPFKKGQLENQTKGFLELMEVVTDAIATYRDEVVDQRDAESGENIS